MFSPAHVSPQLKHSAKQLGALSAARERIVKVGFIAPTAVKTVLK
jgi:hypothetical protein